MKRDIHVFANSFTKVFNPADCRALKRIPVAIETEISL